MKIETVFQFASLTRMSEAKTAFDVDAVIKKILDLRGKNPEVPAGITADELRQITAQVIEVFKKESSLLEVSAPIRVCGDIRGQIQDLIRIFDKTGYPPETQYLFLGNYVNSGPRSVETICLLFCYKIKYPDRVFMLRGSHERKHVMRAESCFDELMANYREEWEGLFTALCEACNWLPFAAIVSDKVFCVHSGIDPALESLDDIRELKRPMELGDEGLASGLLWNNPDPDVDDWDVMDEVDINNMGKVFGKAPVETFLKTHDFDLIVRGHQIVSQGYEFPCWPDPTIITVFSASNCCYEYDNNGAVLKFDENLVCSFEIFEPVHYPVAE